MRTKRSLALVLVGVLCLASAAGLTGYNFWDANRAGETAAEGLSAVVQHIEAVRAEAAEAPEVPVTLPPAEQQQRQAEKQMATVNTDGRVYVGVIEIPALGLSLPVLSQWSYPNLKIAPCLYTGSPYTDDLVLCAHNYRSHFNALRWVDMGAEVFFTTVSGETFRYVIVNRETLQPNETERLVTPDDSWQLTLFTCYVGGGTRCVIRCERAD